jgi:hypothetical protein
MLLGLVATAVMACTDDGSVPEPARNVDRNLWNTAWDEATDSQRAVLKDGALTFAEYEAAALRTV